MSIAHCTRQVITLFPGSCVLKLWLMLQKDVLGHTWTITFFQKYKVIHIVYNLQCFFTKYSKIIMWKYTYACIKYKEGIMCIPVLSVFLNWSRSSGFSSRRPVASRYWAAKTLGAKYSMFCSPHPVGSRTSESSLSKDEPNRSPEMAILEHVEYVAGTSQTGPL